MSGASDQMRTNWDRRARRDAFYYVETAHWDGDVEGFFALGEERAKALIDPVLTRLPSPAKTSSALDLGCGLGRFSRALAARFRTVLGVDVSGEMVAKARELHADERFSNLRFEPGDGVALPAPDSSQDFVWSYEVIQHMPSVDVIRANLAEVARVLAPAGVALLHIRTADEAAGLRLRLGRVVPDWAVSAARRALGRDPLVGDRAFRGAPPIARTELSEVFREAGLAVDETRDDPTHAPGTRVFVVAAPLKTSA